MKPAILMIVMCVFSLSLAAQENSHSNSFKVIFSPVTSYRLLEPNEDLRKLNIFLDERNSGRIGSSTLIIGASLIGIGSYQKSNQEGKFGYLMRHPTSKNQTGEELSEILIHSFQLGVTGSVTAWLGMHVELLGCAPQSFGTGIVTDVQRNLIELRKGFIVLGNSDRFPLYGALGKMDAPFGQTGTVNPFTNSSFWHAFGGLGNGAQIGFKKWGIEANFMAVQGGPQFRGMNTIVGDTTNLTSQLNNFVADLNYTITLSHNIYFLFGGSYLHGCAYGQDFPVIHFDTCVIRNPAYTAYARASVNKRLILMGGYAVTGKEWPGTYNPNPPLDEYPAHKVSSMQVGAKYIFNQGHDYEYAVSGEFSNFVSGPEGAPWERQNQIIIGFSTMIKHSSKLFFEFLRTDGYVPLNFISGSDPNDPFPKGTTHSVNVKNAYSTGFVIGGQITL